MTRHQFLQALHAKLQPKVYLEIGVQLGESLRLAEGAEMAIGVDPQPLLDMSTNQRPNQIVYYMTSDDFFVSGLQFPPVDLAFIDGMHLVEYSLRDWLNVQKHMAPGGVIVFDDMLPYNAAIARRIQPPGDWTGDVWKLFYILAVEYGQEPLLVDTTPTGTMVLLGVEPRPSLLDVKQDFLDLWMVEMSPRPEIIDRAPAYTVEQILEML